METIGQRLRAEREAQKVSRKELAQAMGVAVTTLSDLELDESASTTKLHRAAKRLGLNVAWLETGKGPKLLTVEPNVQTVDASEWSSVSASRQGLAAGNGRVPDDYAETNRLLFRTDSLRRKGLKQPNLQVHYVSGDSMLPRLKDGDAILVDISDTRIKDGAIYWIRYDGHHFVKQLHKAGKSVVIESMNKTDPQWKKPVVVDAEDDFEVIGRVRWIGSWED